MQKVYNLQSISSRFGVIIDRNEMNKVCLVIHSLGIGGMERVMAQLAANFSEKKGKQVDVILIGKKREVVFSLPSNVQIHRPSFQFKNSRRMVDTLRTIFFLRNKVKEVDPDVVLSFGEFWNNLVLGSLFGLSYPVFISDRSTPGKDLGTVQNFLRNTLYPRAAGYIAQTEEAKRKCLSEGWNSNIKVIGNPIREIQTNGKVEKENIVLSVGRLIGTKHFDQLIRIFAELNNPLWRLVIVGGDAKRLNLSADLKKLISELGAEDSIYLEGEQKDIDKYYHRSKIFAFTSSSEGFPNVIGEALSAGLPVVAYDCVAGPADMIKHKENGFLIPLFDKQNFKETLSQLMGNEDLRDRLSNKASCHINEYETNKIADKYIEFLGG